MTDIVDKATRSRMMSGIKGKNTQSELFIRKNLHRLGYRYRLHYPGLPGRPDIALPKYKAIILINGCFWHGHQCHLFKWPSTRTEFWRTKIEKNMLRDRNNLSRYRELGWKVLVIWECATRGKERMPIENLLAATVEWLHDGSPLAEISGLSGLHYK